MTTQGKRFNDRLGSEAHERARLEVADRDRNDGNHLLVVLVPAAPLSRA